MNIRCTYCQRICRAGHGCQHFIIHFYQFFGLFQNLRRLSCHKGNGISQITGAFSHRNHGIPVLLQMSDLDRARDIRCGQDADNAFQRFRFLGMDGQNPCPGILCADCTGMNHTRQFHIITVFPCSQYLTFHIDAVHIVAHIRSVARICRINAFPQKCRRQ